MFLCALPHTVYGCNLLTKLRNFSWALHHSCSRITKVGSKSWDQNQWATSVGVTSRFYTRYAEIKNKSKKLWKIMVPHFLPQLLIMWNLLLTFFLQRKKNKQTSESCSSYIWIQDCVGGTRIAGHVPSAWSCLLAYILCCCFSFFFHLLHLLWNNNNSQGAKDICALISHCPLHPAFL